MPPIHLNRRRFLGCSAAAGIALAQGQLEGQEAATPVRLGLIGLGNRGTTLLRTALELPGVRVVALADPEPRHRLRGQGIVEKATGNRPEAHARDSELLARPDLDAVLVAVPCDQHLGVYAAAIYAGKHLYAEKPLAPTAEECRKLERMARRLPGRVVHVGFQRRSNPRFRAGVERIRRGDLGVPLEFRGAWSSSNGPVGGHDGWLGRRERSGDWMVEQAVHIWDLLLWIKGEPPARAFGGGRRGIFAATQPERDVTDWYSAQLEWRDGFVASFVHSWIDPADDAFTGLSQKLVGTDGGLDFGSGVLTFRDRSRPREVLHPGNLPETRLALEAFLDAVRAERPEAPPCTLPEATRATLVGLLVRKAVDERRLVTWDEIDA
jgi:myo-inositol 2-dehydrogenase/D-chiro-inositol 1-dehydrogenase